MLYAIPIGLSVVVAIGFLIYYKIKKTKVDTKGFFGATGASLVLSCLLTLGMDACGEHSQTRDTEFWGSFGVTGEYFEDWDERVSCRHPEYCERTVSRTDAEGKSYTTTESYQCGWQHPYDVDYHPEHWVLNDNLGASTGIPKEKFEELAKRWGSRAFVELNRNYHSDDGDKYVTKFDNHQDHFENMVREHTYENRVQVSSSVFNFQKVDPNKYGLYSYPGINGYDQACLLGEGDTTIGYAHYKLKVLNSVLGSPKQVKVFILVHKDKPFETALEQASFWKGGNKNEFIVQIGVGSDLKVNWAHVTSWSEQELLKAETKDFILSQEKLYLLGIVEWLGVKIHQDFKRKQFADFAYLTVDTPTFVYWTSFIGSLVVCVGAHMASLSSISISGYYGRRRV